MKISCKVFTQKGNFRFIFTTFVDCATFEDAEKVFSDKVRGLFGSCMYQIITIEQ